MQLTKKMAYLLGALRDGTVSRYKEGNKVHSHITFYSKDIDWLIHLQKLFLKVFNENLKINKPKGGTPYIRKYSKELVDILNKEFQHPIGKQIKWKTPNLLFENNSKKIWAEYIAGFFDAEGGIIPNRQINFHLSWDGETCPVLKDIKLKLKELFNIDSGEVRGYENKNGNYPRFCLRIGSKKSRKLFCKFFKLHNPSKYMKLVGDR